MKNNTNIIEEMERTTSLKEIAKQLKVSNCIAILDRLWGNGTITEESYTEELKELLVK